MQIDTPRLILRATRLQDIQAELDSPAALAKTIAATVPEQWPPEFHDRQAVEFIRNYLELNPDAEGWVSWYVILRNLDNQQPTLIGISGFKGRPTPENTAEIGYSILSPYQHQGYATEVAQALVKWAFQNSAIQSVIAETLPELVASQRVLERNGFRLIGPGSEEGVIRYQLERSEWEARSK